MRKTYNIDEIKEEQKKLDKDMTDLKINYEKLYEKLLSIERYLKQAIDHQCELIDTRMAKIEKDVSEHAERIQKLEQMVAKFVGAAVVISSLTGLITDIVMKIIAR